MKPSIIIVLIYSLSVPFTSVGGDILITFNLKANTQSVYPNGKFVIGKDTVQLDMVRFYLSEFTFTLADDTVHVEPEGYRLLDFNDSASMYAIVYVPDDIEFDAVRFRLGVDSVNSSTGAHTGALDPGNGMYWAWHTGYVNLKIEGACITCPKKEKIELHIGGFQSPFNAERNMEFPLRKSNNLIFEFDLGPLLGASISKKQFKIMSPGAHAMEIADLASKSIQLMK
jgi:hypothetical protein